jgi:hypothetical protein
MWCDMTATLGFQVVDLRMTAGKVQIEVQEVSGNLPVNHIETGVSF